MHGLSLSQFFPRVGVDIGTARTRIWSQELGVCLDEPSCLAFDTASRRVIAVGDEAAAMEGRVGAHIEVRWPVHEGIIADPDAVQALLKIFFQKAKVLSILSQPIVMASVPAEASAVARDSVVDVLYRTGAREVYTIAQPLAASIGAGVPIADASGSFVLHLGAGVVEGAVISLGSIVHTVSTVQAGNYLTMRIRSTVKRELELSIGLDVAAELQRLVMSARPGEDKRLLVTGQDLSTQGPRELEISSVQLKDVALQVLQRYEQLLRQLLSQLAPELTVDVIDKGLLLSGGLAQLEGADSYFVHALGIPVSVVDDPDRAVIRGIGVTLEHLALFKESLGYQV
jgi:rod shape-determining protein MreB